MTNLKSKAKSENIPILSDEGISLIISEIEKRKLSTMLEIGTAVGYSSIVLSEYLTFITTLERDEALYLKALENIKEYNKTNIEAVLVDAHDYKVDRFYDLIFIDAAKAQYEKFFIKYKDFLTDKGIIICDNLNFHNLDINKVSRGTRSLIKKLENFKEFLKENKEFKTEFYNVGDGLSVSWRRK
ncbi:MAG: O-methyltransferase [Acholeplasmatales bacterium]